MNDRADHDVVIIGASLAGCTAAILLGRAGLRVALVEKSPDPASYKRICTHFIQSSAVVTLKRLGILEDLEEMGALRPRSRLWTRWGWIEPPQDSTVPASVNIRRERLDPFMRSLAGETEGVELMLGLVAQELERGEDGAICGVIVRGRDGERTLLRAPLTIGADGRDSKLAELAKVRERRLPQGRFAYGAYYEGPAPEGSPDGSLWILDPQMVAAFPTDGGLTFYACMPTQERLPEFRKDPLKALEAIVANVPDAPPILASQQVSPVQGKLDMTNVLHVPIAPGFALVGDAAAALDPLWGIGCGFALQTSEWLADAVTPALAERRKPLEEGLEAYRKRYAKGLKGHISLIVDYATGRRMNFAERMMFSAATRDSRLAVKFEAFGTRNIAPGPFIGSVLPRAAVVNARHALRPRASAVPARLGGQAAGSGAPADPARVAS
ncbi:MAG TPA: NAD(P)/FAD-dependent oxidoreductase [Solirubrobacteraceae bacterium]